MGNIFRFDSKFGQLLSKIADCAALSLLWLVFCMPVITAGAATSALYYTAVKVLRKDEGAVVKEFWHALKVNFRQSTLALLLALVFCVLWGLICLTAYTYTASNLTIAYLVYFLVLGFGVMWLHYLFSYIARFQDKFTTVLRNSLYICLANFPYSLLALTLFAMVLFVVAATLPRSLWALLVLPGVYGVLVSLILEPVYEKYLPAEEEA